MIYPSAALLLVLLPSALGGLATARSDSLAGPGAQAKSSRAPVGLVRNVELKVQGVPGVMQNPTDTGVARLSLKNITTGMWGPPTFYGDVLINQDDHRDGKDGHKVIQEFAFWPWGNDVAVNCTVELNEKLGWGDVNDRNAASVSFQKGVSYHWPCGFSTRYDQDWMRVNCGRISGQVGPKCDEKAWKGYKKLG